MSEPSATFDCFGGTCAVLDDVRAETLDGLDSFAVVRAGDRRLGGAAGLARPVEVERPLPDGRYRSTRMSSGAPAVSGPGPAVRGVSR